MNSQITKTQGRNYHHSQIPDQTASIETGGVFLLSIETPNPNSEKKN
jgi:hypothetical protein